MYTSNASLPTSPSPVISSLFLPCTRNHPKVQFFWTEIKFSPKDSCLFREEFIISDSSSPEENYNSEEKKPDSWGKSYTGLLPRLIILIWRISCMSDSCYKNTNFFSQEREPFNGVFFWKETLLCSQDDIHLRKELWVLSKD